MNGRAPGGTGSAYRRSLAELTFIRNAVASRTPRKTVPAGSIDNVTFVGNAIRLTIPACTIGDILVIGDSVVVAVALVLEGTHVHNRRRTPSAVDREGIVDEPRMTIEIRVNVTRYARVLASLRAYG